MTKVNNHTAFGNSTMLARLYTKPVRNQSIISEEEDGYGSSLLGRHVTEIADNDVRRRVMQMSVLEIIN